MYFPVGHVPASETCEIPQTPPAPQLSVPAMTGTLSVSTGFLLSPVLHVWEQVWVQQQVSVQLQSFPESFLEPLLAGRNGSFRLSSHNLKKCTLPPC